MNEPTTAGQFPMLEELLPARLLDPRPHQARPWHLIVNPLEAEALRKAFGELPPNVLVSEPIPSARRSANG